MKTIADMVINGGSTADIGTDHGYIPAYLNGERVKLIVVFDEASPEGYIAGAEPEYGEDVTQTAAKGSIELADGDELDFICDYYSYDGEYQNTYYLGDPLTISAASGITLGNMDIGKDTRAVYRITDIYDNKYWTQVIP